MSELKTYKFPYLGEEVHYYTLENKHRVITIKKPGEISNISTWVKTGSVNENDQNNGVSHFLEHLLFKGTERLKPGEFDKLMESRGAIINAATWKDYTYYYVTIPRGDDNENLNLAVDVHADMVINSILPEDEIGPPYDIKNPEIKEKRERIVVIEEISMREDQPWTKTYNALNQLMYSSHPYKRDTIGTREIIASIPREEIVNYYKAWYVPENMATVIVSDNSHEVMLELVRKHFNFKQEKAAPASDYVPEEPTKNMLISEITGEVTTGYCIMGFHGPVPANMRDSICIHIASIALGEGRSSRLMQNLIEKPQTPFFNMISCVQYQFRDGNNILIQGNFKAEHKEEAVKALMEQINDVRKNPINIEELDKAKKKLKSSFAETAETVSSLAEAVGYAITLTNDIENYVAYLDVLEQISLEEVDVSVKKHMNLDNAYLSLLIPKS